MAAVLARSLEQGALGFSTSQAPTHNDGDGVPVPSRGASAPELETLCAVLSGHPGTTLELIVPGCLNGFSDDEVDLMTTLSLLADRPANWNVLGVSALNPDGLEHQLEASTRAAERGATVVALTLPHTMKLRLSFDPGTILDSLPGWREMFALPVAERMQVLSDPAERARLDAGAKSKEAGIIGALARWENLRHRRDVRGGERGRTRDAPWATWPARRARTPSTPCSTWSSPTGCAPGCARPSPSPTPTGGCGPRCGRTRAPWWVGPTPGHIST